MRVKLSKIELPDEASMASLSHAELLELAKTWRDKLTQYQGILFRVRKKLYGSSSEKSQTNDKSEETSGGDGSVNEPTTEPEPTNPKPRSETTKRPSERYPEAPIREEKIDFDSPVTCTACGCKMSDSGMTEDCEYLDVESRTFTVVQQKRHKHRCHTCHGSIVTAPAPDRVVPGGSYSDNLIIDATLSKYCDLIPMERYCQIAARSGLIGLPPHSLIAASFALSEFMRPVYESIQKETLNSIVLYADETPHRMLEGDEKTRWYLWGFSSETSVFFECHSTRSGDVSSEVLSQASCEVLITDAFSGYIKSINEANIKRGTSGLPLIQPAYCNAHARRYFLADQDESGLTEDARIIINHYKEIYRINAETKGLTGDSMLAKRDEMRPHFTGIYAEAQSKVDQYSNKSAMGKAYRYFMKFFEGLTLFLTNPAVKIDNNQSERLLRSHVIGRKTWYGTHSPAGAEAAAIHFSIVESCKMNGVNPREFYADAIDRIHQTKKTLTPRQFLNRPPDDSRDHWAFQKTGDN
jgi:transposase